MDSSILVWLDRAAGKFTDRTVYSDKDNRMTFQELNNYTKAIGTWIARELVPGQPVAVMTGRHIYTPACYLGVVRAGCFYAPMDATMPEYRLNQILTVIHADLMIVDKEHLEKARALEFEGNIVVLEEIIDTPWDEGVLAGACANLHEQSPLYVIFTSGSTGIPKGVVTSHHSLMCYIDAVQRVLELDESDVIGGQAPLDYIAAIRDIYLPLRTGASTYIIPKNIFAMPVELFETLNEQKVTALGWSVAGLELPVKQGAFEYIVPLFLKKVIFSGAVLKGQYLEVWQRYLPDTVFINQYGPTETTASCTYYVVKERADENTVLPIGVPYSHYSITLLNEDGTETPEGEIGEICVGGPCLALGYYGNTERTEASFIQNPTNPYYRELIYKTGDLGRMRPDGLLEFCGRKDRQVKHMGHRIELEEIEMVAERIEGVEEAVALYDKEKERLWLFYTGTAQPKEISISFRKQLPAFMVPRKFMCLDTIPCLPNGKKDMKVLELNFK